MKLEKESNKMTLEKLAILTVNGFEQLRGDLGGQISELKTDVTQLKADVTQLKADVTQLKADANDTNDRVRKIERDLFYAVKIFDIEDLVGRVSYIERKMGIENGKT